MDMGDEYLARPSQQPVNTKLPEDEQFSDTGNQAKEKYEKRLRKNSTFELSTYDLLYMNVNVLVA